MVNVVGTMFFNDKKLLIDKPRKRSTYQMVGGKVEHGETVIEAAIRECHEELGKDVILNDNKFRQILDFDEIATSNPNQKIHFYVFMYEGKLEGKLSTSEEIESFLWYESKLGEDMLSNTLKNEVVPYCIKNNLIN